MIEENEDTKMWRELKEESKTKRWKNVESSLALLRARGIVFETLDKITAHYRVGGFSFWPTTGKYYDPKTGIKGRGVKNLIKQLKEFV